MKKFILGMSLVLSSMVNAEVIEAPVKHLFVPAGYDNNDNVELVVTGVFPNTCYSNYKSEVKVSGDQINIKVLALTKENEANVNCENIEVAYKEVVTVGSLQGGNYKVLVNEKKQDTLNISEASTNSVDDHVYAVVDYIDLGFTGGASGDALIVGTTPNGCFEFDKVEYLSNNKDTLSIMPILKKVRDICGKKRSRIYVPVKFNPAHFNNDQVLLFTRTIQGKSVNAVVEK
jgi:hypothetical protein